MTKSLRAKKPSRSETTKKRVLKQVVEEGAKKRLNAEVEPDLYKRIKLKAVEEDRSISDITRQLWIEYLSK